MKTNEELTKLFRARSEQALIDKYSADETLRFQWLGATPSLLMAAQKGLPELTGLLLGQGEDPDVRDARGNTGLHLICAIPRKTQYTLGASMAMEIGQLLVSAGCRCNQRNSWGQNAVNFGTEYFANYGVEGVQLVEFLLGIGEDPNLADERGRTALHNLAYSEDYRLELYQALIDGGGDRTLLDQDGKTPFEMFQYATEDGNHIHAPREVYESIRELLNPQKPDFTDKPEIADETPFPNP